MELPLYLAFTLLFLAFLLILIWFTTDNPFLKDIDTIYVSILLIFSGAFIIIKELIGFPSLF